jgi:hypothetical protein
LFDLLGERAGIRLRRALGVSAAGNDRQDGNGNLTHDEAGMAAVTGGKVKHVARRTCRFTVDNHWEDRCGLLGDTVVKPWWTACSIECLRHLFITFYPEQSDFQLSNISAVQQL